MSTGYAWVWSQETALAPAATEAGSPERTSAFVRLFLGASASNNSPTRQRPWLSTKGDFKAMLAGSQETADPRTVRAWRVRLKWLRLACLGATCGFFAVAVLEYPTPLVMALGVVPVAWIVLETVWHLTADEPRNEGDR